MTNEKRKELVITGPSLEPLDPSISVADILLSAIKQNDADSVAQIEVETGRQLTFGQLLKDSLSVAQGLKAEGIGEGSVVAVVTFNSQEAYIITLASIFTGATVAPLDPGLTPDEIGHFIKLIQPKIIFCDDSKTLNKIEQAHKVLSYTPVIVVSGVQKHSHVTTFQDLKQPTDVEFKPYIKNPEDHIVFIIPTSGTTGLPKGVMLSDLYIANVTVLLPKNLKLLLLVTSPLFWISGIICFINAIVCGYSIVYLGSTVKENTLLRIIQDHKIDLWVTSPTALQGIVASPYKNAYDITSLKLVFAGGASLSAESVLQIQNDLFHNKIPILQAYGMTEIGIISSCDDKSNKPGSVGLLKHGCKCKIENVATGESLGPGIKGEVCIKAPYIMKGYVNNPKAKAELFDKDGWVHTGDLGYYDEEGYLFVVDRMKEMIKYKSYHISPSELEDILRKHPAVKDALVVGVPHPTDGDHATAFVVPNKTVSEDELVQFVAERVSETKQLRGGVRFVEEIPCTPTGKPKRKLLRDQLIARNNSSNEMLVH